MFVLWLTATGAPAASAIEHDPAPDEERLLLEALQADADREDDDPRAARSSSAAAAAFQSMNPDISVILDVAGAWFSDTDHLQTGAHDPVRNGFNLQQLEMGIESNVDPFLRFNAYLVFSAAGVEVEEAYATTLALPGRLQLRAGQFLHRFGRVNATHPHAWHFVDQSIVIGKFFGPEGSRGLGIEFSWLLPLPWFAEVLTTVSDPVGGCCARSFYGNENIELRTPAEFLFTSALRQFFPFSDSTSLLWGLSTQFGPNASGLGNRTAIYGTDLYLRYRPIASANRASLSLQTEWLVRSRQVPDDVLQDLGGYAQLVWQPRIRWETGLRYEFTSGVEDDPLDPEEDRERHRLAAQLTYYPSHFSRIRLQPFVDVPTWRADPIFGSFLALEVLVGAHGAHAF
ncbi:MAG: zinc-regulated TonB-dependent outer membrane receptor [Deltaproteobacteria bacterium]|nr:MAG: zinc-regulated TonB-dependent outer membrane receptor [Deltaproteobacteria bacterium]